MLRLLSVLFRNCCLFSFQVVVVDNCFGSKFECSELLNVVFYIGFGRKICANIRPYFMCAWHRLLKTTEQKMRYKSKRFIERTVIQMQLNWNYGKNIAASNHKCDDNPVWIWNCWMETENHLQVILNFKEINNNQQHQISGRFFYRQHSTFPMKKPSSIRISVWKWPKTSKYVLFIKDPLKINEYLKKNCIVIECIMVCAYPLHFFFFFASFHSAKWRSPKEHHLCHNNLFYSHSLVRCFIFDWATKKWQNRIVFTHATIDFEIIYSLWCFFFRLSFQGDTRIHWTFRI